MNAYRLITAVTSITWLMAMGGCGQQPTVETSVSAAGPRASIDKSTDPPSTALLAETGVQPASTQFVVMPDSASEMPAELPRDAPSDQIDVTPPSSKATWDAALPGSPAAYDLAVKNCDALRGTEQTVCMHMADSSRADR